MKEKNQCLRTGAYVLLDNLVQQGVEYIFGYPGGAILPIYDELYYWEKNHLLKHILVRHEQSAAHAADAYARSTKKIGVCFATSGPGATNLVTGIATARMDSIPLVIITGQVTRTFIGTDAFQETDIFGITLPIVKHSYTVRDINVLPKIISEAFFLAQNGRPGPVLIDIPKDVGLEEIETYRYIKVTDLFRTQNYRTEHSTTSPLIQKVFTFLQQSYQPLFYIGGGVIRANAMKSLHQLAKLFQIPVTTTLMGKSAYNESDYLSLGMLGMHGTAYANFAISECDLLLAIGARFDDRVTGKLEEFACEAEVIHFDIDPAEISKNRCPQLSLLGDSQKLFLEILKTCRIDEIKRKIDQTQTRQWRKRLAKWKETYPLQKTENFSKEKDELYPSQKLSPQRTISYLGTIFPEAFFTTDVGQHQMWGAQLINCQPKKWISSSGLGTMGFGLPAAIGVKVAHPNQSVICLSGDSSIQMNIQELGTLAHYNLSVQIFIINNGWQGMVRQWQESFYGNRFSNSYMRNGMPDFVTVAKAYQLHGKQVSSNEELEKCLQNNSHSNETTSFLIDVNVIEDENCYPMVAPGRSNSKMLGLEQKG